MLRLKWQNLNNLWQSPAPMLLTFLLLALAGRIFLGIKVPIFIDEAYYRLWAEQLEWGYYDHPPMIAWWVRLGQTILGDNIFGIRLLSVLSSVFGSIGLYLLAREFNIDKNIARLSVIWVQSIWMIVLAGILATPDIPLVFLWLFTCLCVAKAARLNSSKWWIAAGTIAGIACLAKYTALFLAPGILLWMLSSPRYRAQLASPGPWLATLAALIIFAPNIIWNAQNDWASFSLQFGRSIPEDLELAKNSHSIQQLGTYVPEGFSLIRPVIFLLQQLFFLNPIIFILAIIGGRQISTRSLPDNGSTECMKFILYTSLPLIVYMLTHGFHSWIGGHWPAPIYPMLALLATLSAHNMAERHRRYTNILVAGGGLAILLAASPFLSFLLFEDFHPTNPLHKYALILVLTGTITYASGLISPARTAIPALIATISMFSLSSVMFLTGKPDNPQTYHWPELAEQLKSLAKQHDAKWIGNRNYGTNALLYQQIQSEPIMAQLNERFRYPWFSASWTIEPKSTGIIIEQKGDVTISMLKPCFAQVERLAPMHRHGFSGARQEYDVYLVKQAKINWVQDGC